jgi:hypothetical protein
MRIHILAPSLISLQLIDVGGTTPFFDDMPVLVTAAVTFSSDCHDFCKNSDPGYCEDASGGCYGLDDDETGSVLLRSFSSARNLKLIAEPGMILVVRNRTLTLIEKEDDTRSLGNFLIYFSHSTTMSCPPKGWGYILAASQPRIC